MSENLHINLSFSGQVVPEKRILKIFFLCEYIHTISPIGTHPIPRAFMIFNKFFFCTMSGSYYVKLRSSGSAVLDVFVFNYMETSPLPVKGCKIYAYVRHSVPSGRDPNLSCHTCCDTGLWFWVSSKGAPFSGLLRHTWGYVENNSNPDFSRNLGAADLKLTPGPAVPKRQPCTDDQVIKRKLRRDGM
jgi:hypothetical protein